MSTGPDDFASFYEASYSRVATLVAAMLGDQQQAEDIAQEAFARALIRWKRVGTYDAPEAWVRRVAQRLVIDAGRRAQHAVRISALLAAAQRGHAEPDPLTSTALSIALMRLPLHQRQVLVLYYLADLPVDEIARDVGIPAATVRTRLAAARHRLEHQLGEDPSAAPGTSASADDSTEPSAAAAGEPSKGVRDAR